MTKTKAKRRKHSKSGKGAGFERELCRTLSRWWSGDERDDIFWRTSQSGGRATTRARKGQLTYGQSADIAAVDPVGSALTNVVAIEAKCGYKTSGTPFDWLGGFGDIKKHTWTRWIQQAIDGKKQAGTAYWWLVVRQQNRKAVVIYPYAFHARFGIGRGLRYTPYILLGGVEVCDYGRLAVTPLEEFLECLRPAEIVRAAKALRKCWK